MLLGCDGIWEKLSNAEICEFIEKRLEKKQSLEEILIDFLDFNLAEDTSQGIGCDNMSAILLHFS